jgi:hypothetical protein
MLLFRLSPLSVSLSIFAVLARRPCSAFIGTSLSPSARRFHLLSSSLYQRHHTSIQLPLHARNIYHHSSMTSSSAAPFDRGIFDQELSLVALKIPAKSCTDFMQAFKSHTFDRPRMKRVFPVTDEPHSRYLLLSEAFNGNIDSLQTLPGKGVQ